jgi:YDG domain/MBG domain (YGX type)/F5/8 type C domain
MKKSLLAFLFLSLIQISVFSQGPYTINASAGTGGTISPSGAVIVTSGSNQTFNIAAKSGFQIAGVLVDGVSQGAVSTYQFTNVTQNHTIRATFSVTAHLALNKPATAQDDEYGHEAQYANDADASNDSFWGADPFPMWWKVDLQGIYNITSVVIRNFVDTVRYYQYKIEASTDDVTYTLYNQKTNTNLATDDGDTYSNPATARFLKVTMTYNSENTGAHISDFRVYGTASSSTFNIIASAGAGGTITPQGTVMVPSGSNQAFTIAANTGFQIADVLADGVSVGAVSSYTFNNVTANHTISATFTALPTFTILSSAGSGGTITPLGSIVVNPGGSQSFTIAANNGYQIADVLVDGVSAGANTTYTFNNVTANHTIAASFTASYHLALNKPSSAQSSEDGHGPELANDADGSNNSYWGASSFPMWWKVDLQHVYNITSIVIRNFYVNDGRYYQYNIQISSDDNVYTQIAAKTSTDPATDEGDTYTLNVTGRYLMVNMTNNSANPGVHISDFRVYGTAGLTVSGITANSKVYDGSNAATLNTSGAALVGIISGDQVSLSLAGANATFADANVGTGKPVTITGLTLTGQDAGKYTLTPPIPTANITQKPVIITGNSGQSKVYGVTDPTLTYTYSPALITGDNFTGALGRAPGENVGNYAFTIGTLTAGSNYSLSVAATPTFGITTKAILVTANAGQTKVYGQADPVFTYTNSPALETGDNFTGALGRTAGVNVGTYPFTLGSLTAGSNYTLSVAATPTFSITSKAILVTAGAGQTKAYGQADPAFTYTNSPALETGDNFTGALGRTAGVNVGTYPFTLGSLTAGSNYTLSIAATPTFSITPKAILITADAGQTKVYGGVDPLFTYTNSPALETGDNFTGALGRAAGVDIGSYAYTLGSLTAGTNYSLSVAATPTFGITARPVQITADAKSKVYGQLDPALTYQVTSGSLAYTDAFAGALTRAADESAGNHSILQGTVALTSNYTLTYVGANLNITPLAVTVTADAKTKVVGDADPPLTFVSVPAVGTVLGNSEVISFTGALSRNAGESAGNYPITQGTLVNSNYTITYTGANLTINLATAIKPVVQSEFGVKAYPNPFTDHLYFELQWNKDVKARIEIFNATGVKLATIFSDNVEAFQNYRLEYSPENISTGILFYRLVVDGQVVYNGKLVHKQ